jgi:hypothetical protein
LLHIQLGRRMRNNVLATVLVGKEKAL